MSRIGARTLALILVLFTAGLGLAAPAFAAAPTITSFSPTSGPVGTTVVLTGTGFTSASTVSVQGVAASPVTYFSATKLSAKVPSGATSGKITVATAGGSVTSTGSFTVTLGVTLAATYGPPTTTTTLSASAFGANEAADVYFDTTDLALVTTTAAGGISTTLTIPASASPGTHTVTVVGRRSGLAASASFQVHTNWALADGSSGRAGTNKVENTLSANNVGQLDELWRTPSTGSFALTGGPIVYNGVVYATFRDFTVRAFNLATGTQLWSHPTSFDPAYAPAASYGHVFIVDGDSVVALSAATGAVVWTKDLGAEIIADPIVYGTDLYVSAGSAVYDLDGYAGGITWSTNVGTDAYDPTVGGGRVFVVIDNSDYVVALDAKAGGILWSDPINAFITASTTVSGGFVYAAVSDGRLIAMRTDNGAIVWTYTDPADVEVNSPAVYGGYVYATDLSGTLMSVNATTGALRWSVALPAAIHAYSRPAVVNGVVYANDNAATFAYNVYGSLLWSAPETGYYYGPAIVDGSLVAGTTYAGVVRFTINGAAAPAVVHPDVKRLRPTIG